MKEKTPCYMSHPTSGSRFLIEWDDGGGGGQGVFFISLFGHVLPRLSIVLFSHLTYKTLSLPFLPTNEL